MLKKGKHTFVLLFFSSTPLFVQVEPTGYSPFPTPPLQNKDIIPRETDSFLYLLHLFLAFPHKTLLILWRNIRWCCISVQTYITETPWIFSGDLEIITPSRTTIMFTATLISTYCQGNPTDRPRCRLLFIVTYTFGSWANKSKTKVPVSV